MSVVLVVVCVALLSGCGDSGEASSPHTVTVVERTVTAEVPAEEPIAETRPIEPSVASRENPSVKVRVPNVVRRHSDRSTEEVARVARVARLTGSDFSGAQPRATVHAAEMRQRPRATGGARSLVTASSAKPGGRVVAAPTAVGRR
jgi:hypothetical protein